MQRGSFQGMKTLNKSIILTKILNDGPISRAQIAKETNLTPPTVGSLVKELLERKIVIESAQGTSQGGRKPTLLVVNEQAFYIVGVDAGPSGIEAIFTNLSGEILAEASVKLSTNNTKESFLAELVNVIEKVISKEPKLTKQIIGIGVAMHGVVDAEEGEALFAPNLHLRDIPIKETLMNHFPYMVKVENDARALALAETWFGQGKDLDRLVVVNVGTGVGAGLVINKELYHGQAFIAGEIGHMIIDIHGERCACGNRGCLQTVISGPAIAQRAKQQLEKGVPSSLQSLVEQEEEITAVTIFQEAQAGDEFAQKVFSDTGVYIGIGLTNVIHTINPTKIVLTGGVSKAGEYLLPAITSTVKDRVLTEEAKETKIVLSNLGDQSTCLGAVALVLVELFAKNGEVIV